MDEHDEYRFEGMGMSELFAKIFPNLQLTDGKTWGPWRFDAEPLLLVHTTSPAPYGPYEIDLDSIHNSSEMLSWIFRIGAKSWCSPEDLGHLIHALRVVFDPQNHLCSDGEGGRIEDPVAFLRKRVAG